MKRYLTILFVFGLFLGLTAHPVDQETAKAIAGKFMKTQDVTLTTVYQTERGILALYVFNTLDGFVIVAADDCETPIIGYSHESRFDPDNVPVQMEEYLQDFVKRIQYGIENQIVADETTAKQWTLVKSQGRLNDDKTAKAVAPLITTKWSQGCYYNSLCPAIESQPCGHAEVGCVAVAMGQIMNYWKFPEVGYSSHSYSSIYGPVSANFGSTAYDWVHIPDTLSDASSEVEIEAVATLLYHCGVSVDMLYTNSGSGAHSYDVPDALVHYFKYSREIYREKKGNDNAIWLSKLKDELDSQRPILYSGNGNGSHAFVCDGYDSNDLLHFNWGWGGNADGYFALSHLNPLGYDFNSGNAAIFNIVPQYDPYHIVATAYPPSAGTVNGSGDYHIGDSCTLTAVPSENCKFLYWKKDGKIVHDDPVYSVVVENVFEMEACFSFKPVRQITAAYDPDANDPSCPNASLSWECNDDEPWPLLKQFDVNGETGGMTTDGEYIYVSYVEWSKTPFMMEKFTMDGDLVESFNLSGIPDVLCLAFDGTDFYCNSLHSSGFLSVLFRIDMDNKTVIDSLNWNTWFSELAYDPEYDGFWLGQDYQATLHDRQGVPLMTSPSSSPEYLYGIGYFTAQDGNPHLLLSMEHGVYDYDITNDGILTHPLLNIGGEGNTSLGTCTGQYHGKDALFLVVGESVCIYEIKSTLSQIIGYRLYRSDCEGHTVMLTDIVEECSYLDPTWNDVNNGEYRYGISTVFSNGVESEIVWSNTLTKTNHGIDENLDIEVPTVQKVLENGQIVIIKDGKRYNVSGQETR